MKKLLLLGLGVLMAGVINAQVMFSGVSRAAIQGNYNLSYATGWGNASFTDIEDPANSVQEELVMYADNNEACGPATNVGDLTEKIAVLYRGCSEFGLKAYNA